MRHLARSIQMAMLALAMLALVGCGSAGMADYKYAAESTGAAYASQSRSVAASKDSVSDEGAYGYDEDDSWGGEAEPVDLNQPAPEPKPTEPNPGKTPDKPIQPPKTRMIIYNAQIGLSVFKVEDILEKATAVTKAADGWIQQSTSSSLTIRIPADKFEATVKALEDLGDVTYKNIVGTDVTEEFFDLQIRLKNAMVLRDRYIQLLAQAKTVEASLAIEKEMARLTNEIERMKGRIRFLRDNAAFSTITLTVELKNPTASPGRIPLPFGWLRQYSVDGIIR